MVLTESNLVTLGGNAPNFNLFDVVSGNKVSLNEIKSEVATVIFFIANHCPYVKHIIHLLPKLSLEYAPEGVAFIAISANDVNQYPEDAPEQMASLAKTLAFDFPYLYDESQAVARAYQAACTPDCYVLDGEGRFAYHGQLDSSRPGNDITPTGEDLRRALDAIIAGEPVPQNQKPSIGCSIKWK